MVRAVARIAWGSGLDQQDTSPLIDALLARIAAEGARSGLSESTISSLAVRDGKFVERLRNGRTITVATYEKFMAWLDTRAAEALQRDCGEGNPAADVAA